jgi:hypothetical protein
MNAALSNDPTRLEGGASTGASPVPIEIFLARFPEFGTESPNVIYYALKEAERQTPAKVWGAITPDGVNYLAAHLLAARTHAVGNMIGAPVGTTTGQGIESTLYGQEYMRLRNSLAITGFTF